MSSSDEVPFGGRMEVWRNFCKSNLFLEKLDDISVTAAAIPKDKRTAFIKFDSIFNLIE